MSENDSNDGQYANIREVLGWLKGKTIVDITQHDADDFNLRGECFVQLMLDDGGWVRFPIGDDGFWHHDAKDD
jgi:hypothetical protein